MEALKPHPCGGAFCCFLRGLKGLIAPLIPGAIPRKGRFNFSSGRGGERVSRKAPAERVRKLFHAAVALPVGGAGGMNKITGPLLLGLGGAVVGKRRPLFPCSSLPALYWPPSGSGAWLFCGAVSKPSPSPSQPSRWSRSSSLLLLPSPYAPAP